MERRRNLYPKSLALGRAQKGTTALLSRSGAWVGRKGTHGGVRGMKIDHRGGREK